MGIVCELAASGVAVSNQVSPSSPSLTNFPRHMTNANRGTHQLQTELYILPCVSPDARVLDLLLFSCCHPKGSRLHYLSEGEYLSSCILTIYRTSACQSDSSFCALLENHSSRAYYTTIRDLEKKKSLYLTEETKERRARSL